MRRSSSSSTSRKRIEKLKQFRNVKWFKWNNDILVDIEDGESKNQASTYYNMNSTDVEKAKEARQDVYYEFSPLPRTSATAVPVSDFKTYVENKKTDHEFFDAQFKVW